MNNKKILVLSSLYHIQSLNCNSMILTYLSIILLINQVLTVSADKTAKIWEIFEDGTGKVKKTLECPRSGGVEDMLVGCLWQNDHLITVSLCGTINLFSASDPDKPPLSLSGHMKNITTLTVLKSNQKMILSSSFDGSILRWIQGIGYNGKLTRKDCSQIKCLAAVKLNSVLL